MVSHGLWTRDHCPILQSNGSPSGLAEKFTARGPMLRGQQWVRHQFLQAVLPFLGKEIVAPMPVIGLLDIDGSRHGYCFCEAS